MPVSNENIQLLSDKYPWPQNQPEVDPVEWVLDGGGKKLVFNRIQKDNPFLIVEIGSFLGSSLKQWLEYSPNVYVIAIDPWEGEWWAEYAQKHGRENLVKQLSEDNGPYMTFLSSQWKYRDRIFPVRGMSPEKLYEIADLGIQPDLVYFDSDKVGGDIEIAHTLFPNAILTGDDWTWGVGEGYPIRKTAKSFAKKYGYKIVADRATWALKKPTLSLQEKINNLMSFVRDIIRGLKQIVLSK